MGCLYFQILFEDLKQLSVTNMGKCSNHEEANN